MTALAVGRRGFTLVELLVGLGFALALCGVAVRVLLVGHRVARAQAEHVSVQDNVRAGALIVANELRDLGFDSAPALAGLGADSAASSDILVGQAGRVRYRATRGLGFTCLAPTATQILLRSATWQGLRQPLGAVDSIAVYVEGDPALAEDDAWVRARITGVFAGSCADGAPAIGLATSWEIPAVGAAVAARAVVGGPARVFEVMELRYYPQDGKSWLGMRSVSRGEVIQPLIGPLADSVVGSRGFTLEYLDRDDVATAIPSDVRSIAIGLRGVTSQPVSAGHVYRPMVDTLALLTRVVLRNMVRP